MQAAVSRMMKVFEAAVFLMLVVSIDQLQARPDVAPKSSRYLSISHAQKLVGDVWSDCSKYINDTLLCK